MQTHPGDRNNIHTNITISEFSRCVFPFGKVTKVCYKKISNNLYICEIQSKVDVSHSEQISGRFTPNPDRICLQQRKRTTCKTGYVSKLYARVIFSLVSFLNNSPWEGNQSVL